MLFRSTMAVGLILCAIASAAAAGSAGVPYPDGYRDWRHVKSMVIFDNHPLADPFAGIHHVYANPKAVAGLSSGDFADGSIFVFDLLKAVKTGDAITEGPRKLIGVMVRDGRRYASTGGWGFEAFAAGVRDRRLVHDRGAGCFACHRSVESTGYVFTRPRD